MKTDNNFSIQKPMYTLIDEAILTTKDTIDLVEQNEDYLKIETFVRYLKGLLMEIKKTYEEEESNRL